MSETIDRRKLTGYRLLVEAGRRDISEVPEPYRSAIFALWGDKPTIIEDTGTNEPEPAE